MGNVTALKISIIAGLSGTAVMTVSTLVIDAAGGPRMNAPELLAYLMGIPIWLGWILHFVIGVAFALIYSFLLLARLARIANPIARGVIFGLIAFVIAQVSFAAIGAVFGRMPPMVASLAAMAAVAVAEHVIFGVTVALIVRRGPAFAAAGSGG